jgi:hypothetical protein
MKGIRNAQDSSLFSTPPPKLMAMLSIERWSGYGLFSWWPLIYELLLLLRSLGVLPKIDGMWRRKREGRRRERIEASGFEFYLDVKRYYFRVSLWSQELNWTYASKIEGKNIDLFFHFSWSFWRSITRFIQRHHILSCPINWNCTESEEFMCAIIKCKSKLTQSNRTNRHLASNL